MFLFVVIFYNFNCFNIHIYIYIFYVCFDVDNFIYFSYVYYSHVRQFGLLLFFLLSTIALLCSRDHALNNKGETVDLLLNFIFLVIFFSIIIIRRRFVDFLKSEAFVKSESFVIRCRVNKSTGRYVYTSLRQKKVIISTR